jgi:GrpB-like predicted nucleotidyltransferase (UPF0157 family)
MKTTNILGLCNAVVSLVPWNPGFLDEFHREESRLLAYPELGDINIYHIGSSAIPGMPCKPVIDIMITAESILAGDQIVAALVGAGYECLGECGRPGRQFLVRDMRPCLTTHHVHLTTVGSVYQSQHLAVRAALLNNHELARNYAQHKLNLACEFPMDRMAYRVYKGQFIASRILGLDW